MSTPSRKRRHSSPSLPTDEVESHEVACESDLYQEADGRDLKTKGLACKKNPGHAGFIPVKEFKKEHLPQGWQDEDYLNFILSYAELSVRISAVKVCSSRPEDFPFHDPMGLGQDTPRSGSGWVEEISSLGRINNSEMWVLSVTTAAHVVYGPDEISGTEITLFDDCTDPRLRVREPMTMRAVEMYSDGTDRTKDRFKFICYTRSSYLANRVMQAKKRCKELSDKLGEKFRNRMIPASQRAPVIAISHPHGSTKHISVGEQLGNDPGQIPMTYNTPTCPGSSGGWVASWVRFGTIFPHSKGGKRVNLSGNLAGWYGGVDGGNDSYAAELAKTCKPKQVAARRRLQTHFMPYH